MEWKNARGNTVLHGEGFYISYLGDTHGDPTVESLNMLGGMLGIKTGSTETALVVPNSTPKFRILDGDFRKQYEALVPKGLAACVEFYEKHKATARSDWSSDS